MRHQYQRALETLQRKRERVAHIQIKVVGRFVEQQQIGFLPDQHRQCQSRFFAAGERGDGLQGGIADEVEAAEKIADVLLFGFGREFLDVPQRALVATQGVELVLGEIADIEFVGTDNLAAQRFQAA